MQKGEVENKKRVTNVQGGIRVAVILLSWSKREGKELILFAVKERHNLPFLSLPRYFDKLAQFSAGFNSVLMIIMQNN